MVAAVSDPVEQYRLALSYAEKVLREKEKWARIVESQTVKVTRFDTVAASYRDHERTSLTLKKNLLKPHQKQLPDLQSTLRKKHLQQKRLVEEVSRGKVKAQKANEQNRELAAEMVVLQKAIHVSQAIVNAQSADDLGGLIELPIDEYAIRIDPDHAKRKKERSLNRNAIDSKTLVKGAAALLGIVFLWMGWSYYDSLGKGRFSAVTTQGRDQAIEISCKNTGDKRIKVYAPWPSAITTAPSREKFPRRSFGIQLYVKEKGKDGFRLLPASPGCWYQGRDPMTEGSPVNIPGGRIRRIRFEPDRLNELGIEAAAVRIVITRHGGQRKLEYETNLKH